MYLCNFKDPFFLNSNAQPKKMAISHFLRGNYPETRELKFKNDIEHYFLSMSNFKV